MKYRIVSTNDSNDKFWVLVGLGEYKSLSKLVGVGLYINSLSIIPLWFYMEDLCIKPVPEDFQKRIDEKLSDPFFKIDLMKYLIKRGIVDIEFFGE